MSVFAISDLHLSFAVAPDPSNWANCVEHKPMGDVDEKWRNHSRRIYENWIKVIGEDDIVLLPGDISWAMRLGEALNDFAFLAMLPGRIAGVQGNHDYWWQSISRVRSALPPNVSLIQNDHFRYKNYAICGTRGWLCPNSASFQENDTKVYLRELIRLENSLRSVDFEPDGIIVMMHYMPTNEKKEYSGFIEIMQRYNVSTVVYGHLHAGAIKYRLPDYAWGIRFHLVSADYLNFSPVLIVT